MTAGDTGSATVGRSAESARVGRRIAELGAGRGGVVLLSGEPGIGKTRLALDATSVAGVRGHGVAWGRCPEAGAAPAFWPWIQVVRTLVRAEGAAAVQGRLGSAGAGVLALVEARDHPAAEAAPVPELVTSARFRLFDAIVQLLGGGPRPVVGVIEDLHRADELSVAMVAHLAAEAGQLPVLLVVTYRSTDAPADDAFARVLAGVASLPWCEDIPLGPLPPEDAARLVSSLPECPLDAAGVAAVVARAGGNPLFLQQLARVPPGSGASVPTSVREVIRDRLSVLPEDCRLLLEGLAVAGREADLALAATATGTTLPRALALVAGAQEHGLVFLQPDGRTASFPHALIQETLYAGLDPGRRADLHERFARLVDSAAPGADALRAEHALRAVRGGRDVDCVTPLRAAARSAAGRLAYGEAARLLTEALGQCADRPADRAAVLLELGLAEVHAGRAGDARLHLEGVADLAGELGDVRTMAAAALGIGACVVTVGQVDWALVGRLRQALAALEPADPALRVQLLARLAVELYWHDGGAQSREVSAEALTAAEALPGDPRTLAEALWARLFTLRGPDRLDERLVLGRRLVELAVQERDGDVEVRGRVWWLPELLRAGDLPAYRANVGRLGNLADRSGQPLHRWYAELFAAQRDLLTGQLGTAAMRSAAAAEVAARLGTEAGEIYGVAQRVALCRDAGGLEDCLEPLQEVADRYPALVTLQMMLAVVHAELGHTERAAAGLARVAAGGFAVVPPDSLWTATLCYGAEVAHALGETAVAATAARLLEPYVGTCAVQGLPVAWGAVDRAVGLARLTEGRPAGAVPALESALELHRRWGFAPLVVRTRLDLAIARGMDPEGRRQAERAGEEARSLGLGRLADRAVELLQGPATVLVRGPGGTLSPRETEVLALLAGGVSNNGIAARLVLSVNTVERHVRNVYVKLGVANRAGAAAVAARHQLVPPAEPPRDHGFP